MLLESPSIRFQLVPQLKSPSTGRNRSMIVGDNDEQATLFVEGVQIPAKSGWKSYSNTADSPQPDRVKDRKCGFDEDFDQPLQRIVPDRAACATPLHYLINLAEGREPSGRSGRPRALLTCTAERQPRTDDRLSPRNRTSTSIPTESSTRRTKLVRQKFGPRLASIPSTLSNEQIWQVLHRCIRRTPV